MGAGSAFAGVEAPKLARPGFLENGFAPLQTSPDRKPCWRC